MRKLCTVIIMAAFTAAVYAGDIANFVNLGFSADGTKFAFGQYGLQDKTYRAYAEIYAVDIGTNTFLQNGIFRTSPSKQTEGKESKSTFLALQNRAQAALSKWDISETRQGRVLYAQTEATAGNQTLFFRDFQTSDEYTVVLNTAQKSKTESSFYLTVEKTKPNGTKIQKQVGRPDYIRSGVKNYSVKKILMDDTAHAMIFIIEKNEYASSGDSFRYMVEATLID
jgi:Predicted secreted protein|nr:DUF2259 domain-containing protein [uncultured Treponema sp.]